MNFIKVDTYDKLSEIAANIIGAQVIMKPDCGCLKFHFMTADI